MHTHTLADWLAMVSIAAAGYGAFSAPYFLFVDARLADFDPRPAVRRALDSDAGARITNAAFNAKTTARDTALDAAALVLLLTTRPKGAMA